MNIKHMFLVYRECQEKHFATSSAEAEYIAAFDASKEAVWVRKFISELGVVPTIEEPINMSTRTRHAPDRMCLYIDAEEHELGDLDEPATYKPALLDQDKWLFKKKTKMDGNVHIYKARLMAKGYTQTSGIDYEETFSRVADIRAIRILIAIVAYYDYKICAYIEKILKRYCMENSKRGSIPMQEKLKLSKSQGASTPADMKRMQNVAYAFAVGSIMYDVRYTRPHVVFAQNVTSRFQQNPELRVSCYTDAGYLTDADDLKSQTGYVFVLNGGAVDWKSAKQSIFATSYVEAKYIAAFDASKEAVWVRKFIFRLSVVPII
nr:putative retrotransposon protein [Tanacetum cinerariifolium]